MFQSEAKTCIFSAAHLTQKSLIHPSIFSQVVVWGATAGGTLLSTKIGFVTSVRRTTPRPGLWRLHPHKEGFYFLSTPVLTSLTFTSCTQWLLECSCVCGANEISQRSHQLCCQPRKCLFITRMPSSLPPLCLCCSSSGTALLRHPTFWLYCSQFFFVCGHPKKMQRSCNEEFTISIQITHGGKGRRKSTICFILHSKGWVWTIFEILK